VIAFGSPIADAESYWQYAERGIRLAAEPDSVVLPFAEAGSLSRSCNLLLEHAAARDDLEAFVLLHPHAELVDPDLCAKARRALSDPDVGIVGCAGASGVRSIAWWEGELSCAPNVIRYEEFGGGQLPAFSWRAAGAPPAEVDALDGFVMVLSPWVVRNLRFDESLVEGLGVDVDFCFQVRESGRKAVTADLRVIYHRSLELVSDPKVWVHAHMRFAEKWEGRLLEAPGEDGWRGRARRAEAEREAARALAQSKLLGSDARVLQLERELDEKLSSPSWRITAPLRWINQMRRARSAEQRQSSSTRRISSLETTD
jgi:GT2 family glycosyltransferase